MKHDAIQLHQYFTLYFVTSQLKVSTCCFPPLPLLSPQLFFFFRFIIFHHSLSSLAALNTALGLFLCVRAKFFFTFRSDGESSTRTTVSVQKEIAAITQAGTQCKPQFTLSVEASESCQSFRSLVCDNYSDVSK